MLLVKGPNWTAPRPGPIPKEAETMFTADWKLGVALAAWIGSGLVVALIFGRLSRVEQRLDEHERAEVMRNSGEHDGV